MGLKFKREKERFILLSMLYRLAKLNPLSRKKKLKLYLELSWIFDRFAHSEAMSFYEIAKNPIRTNTLKFLSSELKPGYKVLDIGCSKGDLTNLIADYVSKITGVDHDMLAIKNAKLNYGNKNIQFISGDALEHVKNVSEKYDLIILSHILEHIDDPIPFLSSYIPYTKYIYVEVPDYEKSYHNIFRKDVGAVLQYTDDDHVSEFDREEAEGIFNSLNLEILRKEFRHGVMRYFLKSNSDF